MDFTPSTNLPQRFRAIVLDDDAVALRDLRVALERRRFEVSSAPDGASGLSLLLDELLALDVLVVDVDLPGRDARALAELIRRRGGERDLAIVVLAGEVTPDLSAELVALGVDAVVGRGNGPGAVADAVFDAVTARSSRASRAEASWVASMFAPPASASRLMGRTLVLA